MVHHPKTQIHSRPPSRHRWIAGIVVALMILALAVYGYQFWWSE